MKKHAALESSMLLDLRKGKLCEIDYINGVVSAVGRKYGVATPFNDRTVEIIHRIEQGEEKINISNVRLYDELF